jgi:hypothetical protein
VKIRRSLKVKIAGAFLIFLFLASFILTVYLLYTP